MQQHTVCPCKACLAITNLTLKFVVHHGPVAEMKVGRFVHHSGLEMIVAHRLMKNSINNNEYLLMTEKLLEHIGDLSEDIEMKWISSAEEYASIGKVNYRFTLLNEARKNVPQPPEPQNYYRTDDTSYLEITIAANFFDVYMVIMNIPGRPAWIPGLQKVEQDTPDVFIGSIHYCTFENYKAVISPLRMTFLGDEIIYAESCRINEMNLSLVQESIFKKIDERTCGFASRFLNAGEVPVPEELNLTLSARMEQMAETLKEYCEHMKEF